MGYTVDLVADDLWCRSNEDALAAATLISQDAWAHPYHLIVAAVQCAEERCTGDWLLGVEHFQGDHWSEPIARALWVKIAPHMADGASLELCGEEQNRWRVRWEGGRAYEDCIAEVLWTKVGEVVTTDAAPFVG